MAAEANTRQLRQNTWQLRKIHRIWDDYKAGEANTRQLRQIHGSWGKNMAAEANTYQLRQVQAAEANTRQLLRHILDTSSNGMAMVWQWYDYCGYGSFSMSCCKGCSEWINKPDIPPAIFYAYQRLQIILPASRPLECVSFCMGRRLAQSRVASI